MKGQSLRIRGNIENQDGLSDEKTTLLFRVLSKETREICGGCENFWYWRKKEEKEREKERRKKNERERERERERGVVGSCKHEEESMFANKVVIPGHLLFGRYQQPTSWAEQSREKREKERNLMNIYLTLREERERKKFEVSIRTRILFPMKWIFQRKWKKKLIFDIILFDRNF